MELANLFSGGAPVIEKYQVEETFANAGVPALIAANTTAGVDLPSTTGAADFIGVTLDTATHQTAQQSGTTAAETVSVIVNPDAVYRARLSGSATAGTALPIFTVVTADTAGTSVVLDTSVASPDLEDGVIWGYSGANVGQYRKITGTSTVTATVVIPFDNDIAVGDTFLVANRFEADVAGVTLTSDFTELSSQVAENASGAEFRVVKMDLRAADAEGTTHSHFFIISSDHAYGGGT